MASLPSTIRDPRSDVSFYRDGVFVFDAGGHHQAWAILNDLHHLAKLCGKRGLVLLFDEFEDVIQNLNNIKLQQDAFVNLFRLFSGADFHGQSYFAVTPEFSYKCRERLYEKYVYDFPVERFDDLERLEVTPIGSTDFEFLARTIRRTHGVAYEWDAQGHLPDDDLAAAVSSMFRNPGSDQVRQAVKGTVALLDDRLDG